MSYTVKIPNLPNLGREKLRFNTTYPGLLIGSGYMHELKDIEGQLILGFHFDYTSGLPCIPASSIKGVLRSAFKHKPYIQECLTKENINIEALEDEIFEGKDIFFDGFISKSVEGGYLLDDDFITPHKDNPLKNPIPLRFIKIRPNVEFTFQFKLKDGILTKEQKLLLFDQILQDLGIGAKTNVGYGQLNGNNAQKLKEQQEQIIKEEEAKAKQEALANMSPVDRVFSETGEIVTIIQMMQNGEIEDYENIKVALAQRVKAELQKEPKNWEKAKQKSLKRKEFIQKILRE